MMSRFWNYVAEQVPFKSGYGYSYQHSGGLSWLHRAIYRAAWPDYACIDCTATGLGCECAYYGASAPGEGPTNLNLLARWLWQNVNKDRGL